MYNGIKRKIKPIYITISDGIEVSSSILSEAGETNNAKIVRGMGSSSYRHFRILLNIKNVNNSRGVLN
tara:strand:+ start:71 stop:274 length:204 start_codon:yes stop_codon:yes gene_type:complete